MINEKRPRHHAAEILALPTKEERLRALGEVPEHLREWVRDLVVDSMKYGKRREAAQAEAIEKRKKLRGR